MGAPWTSDYVCALVTTSLGLKLSKQQFSYVVPKPYLVSNSTILIYIFMYHIYLLYPGIIMSRFDFCVFSLHFYNQTKSTGCLKYCSWVGLWIINKADPTFLWAGQFRPLLRAPPRELASVQSKRLEFHIVSQWDYLSAISNHFSCQTIMKLVYVDLDVYCGALRIMWDLLIFLDSISKHNWSQ